MPLIKLLSTTFKRFLDDGCFRHSIVISYFALLCAVPLIALLAFAASKILGDVELAVRSLNLFTEDFFAKFDPNFFKKVGEISKNVGKLGWFGLIGSLIAGSFLFSNLILAVNKVFKAGAKKSFVFNRLLEYAIMFIIAVLLFLSVSITAVWSALHRAIATSEFVRENLNPEILTLANNVFIQYLIPFTLGFLVLFVMYKFIPEINFRRRLRIHRELPPAAKIHTRAAVIAAVVGSLLWEIFKRIFVGYVVRFSAVGIVLSKLLRGTLTSIIFFLLWLTFSLAILLWGAELTVVLSERITAKRAAR